MSAPSRLFAALCGAALSLPAMAGAQGFDVADVVTAELRPGWRTESGTHMAALHLRLAEGWKTYWRAPGDAGIPPRFDWSGSENLGDVAVHWPRPMVFELSGIRTLGFADELVLPIEFTPTREGAPMALQVTVDLGVCETLCVPVTLQLAAALPAGGAPDARITAALADRPVPADRAGLAAADCSVAPNGNGLRLTARLDLPPQGGSEVAVVELGDHDVWISETVSHRDGGRLTAEADLIPLAAGFALDRSQLRITVLGDGRAAELVGCPGR